MANPQHEPTMEEILASIRKIISEDSPPSPEPQPNGEVHILDLTQEVHETHASPETAAPTDTDCRGPGLAVSASPEPCEGLFSDKTRAAVEETVAGLSAAPAAEKPGATATGESVGETFERAVREAFEPLLQKWLADNSESVIGHMKPVVRDWLDEHFPAMLENAVKAELARARSHNRRS